MRSCETKSLAAYRLEDAKTGLTLLLIPTYAYGSPHLALCAAGRQARRHAASGTWVLVRGVDKALLYVGEQCYVQCEDCGKWMLPRRRGNCCLECRVEEAEVTTAAGSPSTGRRSQPSRQKRRRRPQPSPNQLTLPEL
jgi:hypothetical protein